jgi:hypothetical protein
MSQEHSHHLQSNTKENTNENVTRRSSRTTYSVPIAVSHSRIGVGHFHIW